MSEEKSVEDGVKFYRENSEIGQSGVRAIRKGPFVQRLEEVHGVKEEDLKRVQGAIDFETNVAAHVSLEDLIEKIEATPKAERTEEFALNVSATTRLPTPGGSTEVTVNGQGTVNIPGRRDADGNMTEATSRTDWGRTRTTINAKGRVDKSFPDEARDRIRKSLGA